MKSPYTGKEMTLVYERRTWKFRGEEIPYIHTAFKCEDSGELFTTDETDTAGFMQVTNRYRERYGIPYTDEIISIRKRYGVSAAKMSLIMGFGANQYRLYELGEVPSVSNGRMIRTAAEPEVFLQMLDGAKHQLGHNEYITIAEKVRRAVPDKDSSLNIFTCPRGEDNGFAARSSTRLKNILLFILSHCGDVFPAKMNSLLFHVDFLSFRELGMAMTGLSYKAFDFGPAPDYWLRVYSSFDEIKPVTGASLNYEGVILTSDCQPDMSSLSPKEVTILSEVCEKLGSLTSRELSERCQKEPAWLNALGSGNHIDFEDAFGKMGI